MSDKPVIVGVVEEEKKRLENYIKMYEQYGKDDLSKDKIKKAQRNLKYCEKMLLGALELYLEEESFNVLGVDSSKINHSEKVEL